MVVEFLNNILGIHRHIKGTCIAEKFDWQDLFRGPLDITNLLHTRYISCGSHGFQKFIRFFQVSPIISLWVAVDLRVWPIWTPEA